MGSIHTIPFPPNVLSTGHLQLQIEFWFVVTCTTLMLRLISHIELVPLSIMCSTHIVWYFATS